MKKPNDEEVLKLTDQILKVIPKFFDNFKGWEYANGKDAGKDFKSIYNKAKRINKNLKTKNQ